MIAALADRYSGALRVATAAGVIAAAAAATVAAPLELTDEEVTAAVMAVIAERSRDGIFLFADPRTGERLSLVLDGVRLVRGLPNYGWFPNVNFHEKGTPGKKYALDFWLRPDGDRLKLMDIRIHKAPKADGSGWMSVTRAPLAWWWLPTMERASAVASVPAWQVMGDLHTQLVRLAPDGNVALTDAGGSALSLQFVDIEQPVGRSKTDGRYFACVLLRKFGSQPVFYSTTYWLDAKTKLVTAERAEKIDVARLGAHKAAAEPHCDVGGIAFDIVD